jgi:hypothetical protein
LVATPTDNLADVTRPQGLQTGGARSRQRVAAFQKKFTDALETWLQAPGSTVLRSTFADDAGKDFKVENAHQS